MLILFGDGKGNKLEFNPPIWSIGINIAICNIGTKWYLEMIISAWYYTEISGLFFEGEVKGFWYFLILHLLLIIWVSNTQINGIIG